MDALTHAIEGYITKAHNTMSDMFHMQAIKFIFEYLPAAVNEKDPEAIDKMGLAQYIAGMGFFKCWTWYCTFNGSSIRCSL